MTAPTPTEVADVLDAAADYIERYGWCKGEYAPVSQVHDGESLEGRPVCALGAVSVGAGQPFKWSAPLGHWDDLLDGVAYEAQKALAAYLDNMCIDRWNDAPERTEQQVLDALRAAAKAQRRLADGAL